MSSTELSDLLKNADQYEGAELQDRLMQLAKGNVPEAFAALGGLYQSGWGAIPQDANQAIQLYRKGIDAGDCKLSARYLSSLYFRGDHVPRDYEQAFNLMHYSAFNSRDSVSSTAVGIMRTHGYGCEIDYEDAERWFKWAIRCGHLAALGHMAQLKWKQRNYFTSCIYRVIAILISVPVALIDPENPRVQTGL